MLTLLSNIDHVLSANIYKMSLENPSDCTKLKLRIGYLYLAGVIGFRNQTRSRFVCNLLEVMFKTNVLKSICHIILCNYISHFIRQNNDIVNVVKDRDKKY